MSGLPAPPPPTLRRCSTREPVALDGAVELGVGGEARVLAVPGDDALVAKLYHQPTPAKARKVALMMERPPELDAAVARLAWPRDLLLDSRGGFAGFLMERVRGPRIFEFYNPATRRHAAPRCDHALLHRVGGNVAAAFGALHARGYVVGDVNESNVLVSPKGAVTLVDTDSMQVRDPADGTVLRSRVGKAEFTPPELQGRPFADFDRSPEHDRFGLAVLLFHLLMEGTHPFAGRLDDGGEMPPIEERIRRGLFPHDDHAEIRPPKLAPDFSLLAPELRALFVRCFEDGHADPSARPTAAEWRAALAAAAAKLRTCGRNRFHRFGAHLDACPWCERAALLGGRDPFPEKAPPPLERRPRGTNRRRAPLAAPARQAAPPRPVSVLPGGRSASAAAVQPSTAIPVSWVPDAVAWLRGLRAPPGLRSALGPSGIRHPAPWVALAAVMIVLGPPFQVIGVMVLVGGLWSVAAHSPARFTSATIAMSTLLLAMLLIVTAFVRTAPSPFAPEAAEFRDGGSRIATPREIPPSVQARLGSVSTQYELDAPPRLLNGDAIERELTARLFHAGAPETPGVGVAVRVREDGTVDPYWMEVADQAHREFADTAKLALTAMQFDPLTVGGAPAGAIVWVNVDFVR